MPEKMTLKQRINTVAKGARLRSMPRRRLFALVLVLAIIFGCAGWFLYSQFAPRPAADPVLENVGVDQQNYEDMTSQQRDAQLKRQIGYTVSELREKDMSIVLLRSHDNALKAAQALDASNEDKRSLDAYAVAAALADSSVGYGFYLMYGGNAAAAGDLDLALQQYRKAKEVLDADTSIKAEAKDEYLREVNWQIGFIEARKGAND